WTLVGARPVKYTGPSLSTKDSETAVEELVLSVEGVNVEPIGVG
ncbi:MAG: phage tail protein, partial [Gammaproteobacteria bacterium]